MGNSSVSQTVIWQLRIAKEITYKGFLAAMFDHSGGYHRLFRGLWMSLHPAWCCDPDCLSSLLVGFKHVKTTSQVFPALDFSTHHCKRLTGIDGDSRGPEISMIICIPVIIRTKYLDENSQWWSACKLVCILGFAIGSNGQNHGFSASLGHHWVHPHYFQDDYPPVIRSFGTNAPPVIHSFGTNTLPWHENQWARWRALLPNCTRLLSK